jgi:RimJ/RimL family protein N-acetyltransferase
MRPDWRARTGVAIDIGVAWRHMAAFLGSWALRGLGQWAVEERAGGAMIGRVGYLDPPDWPGSEIGWLLGRAQWGRGYALEAALAARRVGRERLGATDERDVDLMGQPAPLWRHPAAV